MITARIPAALKRRAFLVPFALTLLVLHLFGMALGAFTQGRTGLAIAVTACGFLAVPLCGWEASRGLDWLLQLALRPTSVIGAVLRLFIGLALVAGVPQIYGLLGKMTLDWIGRILELTLVFLSISVFAGLVMLGLAIADLLFALTKGFRSVSARLIALILVTVTATALWFRYLSGQAHGVLQWAIDQGHLGNYEASLAQLQQLVDKYFGTMVGASIGLELPFVVLLAWRFGKNATVGFEELRAGFDRVGDGNLDVAIDVQGNDEIAQMQRGFNAMLKAARERRFLETAFGRYVSPVVLEKLRTQREQGSLQTERRVATVMFTDIRGFTALSGALPPEEVIALLNRYMSLLIDVVARFDGYINKFIGDAIVVVWNAPLDQADHAARAVRCALSMQQELARANDNKEFGDRRLEMGVGINTGELVMGNLGNERQVEFAVIGDTVNVASRCCSKAAAGQIAVTQAVVDAAAGVAAFASLGEVELKGKGAVELFAVRDSA
jgi:class 3 adenylate cyclase/ABC-type sugar transport system permease subunit